MKNCKGCKKSKSLEDFYSNKGMKDGKLNYCKVCFMKKTNNKSRKKLYEEMKLNPTPELVARIKYSYIKARTKNDPLYRKFQLNLTKNQLERFLQRDWSEYINLHKYWAKKNYNKGDCPVIDRINTNKGYSEKNIQIIPSRENTKKDLVGRKFAKKHLLKIAIANSGEKSYLSKLTEKQVREIRNNTKEKGTTLSKKYNVTKGTISAIKHNRSWKHI